MWKTKDCIMPKKENQEFMGIICPPSNRSYESLLTWIFGEKRNIEICAHTAYRDIQRNLVGIRDYKDKKLWRDDIEELITHCIRDLFTLNLTQQEAFDDWHKNTCEKIMKSSGEDKVPLANGFTYGLAQKWFNMTFKNMRIMEKWDTELDKIKKYLHVPVDSIILKAASEMLKMEIIDKQGQFQLYKEGVSKPWSKWNYDDYIMFQKKLRKSVDCPMDWEFDAWNKIKNEQK